MALALDIRRSEQTVTFRDRPRPYRSSPVTDKHDEHARGLRPNGISEETCEAALYGPASEAGRISAALAVLLEMTGDVDSDVVAPRGEHLHGGVGRTAVNTAVKCDALKTRQFGVSRKSVFLEWCKEWLMMLGAIKAVLVQHYLATLTFASDVPLHHKLRLSAYIKDQQSMDHLARNLRTKFGNAKTEWTGSLAMPSTSSPS
ncbi:uncharacterized protein PSFLO_03891 [Pseudozyma flocculosa]|uniref:Uncharacterized protein n=1 Tax=Pseudozyma flocculosa TaxID=84751 RepID=A0A5C3F1M5_9BASI|nr:uncharacterized protein PSFLO_03891 [Pseudozyma flocculosa]